MMKNLKNVKIALSGMIILAFLAMPFGVNGQAGKANFAGTWALNAEKSTMPQGGGGQGGGGGMRMGGNFTITQDATTLSQTRTGQDGTERTTKYTLDGKETVNTMGQGQSKSTATWSADGKSLTIVTKMTFNDTERTTTAVWSLASPTSLSIVSTRPDMDGNQVKTTMIYDKK